MKFFRKNASEEDDGEFGGVQRRPRSLQDHPNTPAAVLSDGARQFAEIYGSSMVQSQRMFILAVAGVLLAIAAVLAIVLMMPLKEVRPWVVETNPDTGRINRPIEVQKISPNLSVIKAELGRWAEAVYTIDNIRTPELFKFANARSREKAIAQFTEFRIAEKIFERIAREPKLSREVRVTSVDASQKGIAFIFLTTIERGGASNGDVVSKQYRLTAHYMLDPANQETDLLQNPLGLFITFFNAAEERVQ